MYPAALNPNKNQMTYSAGTTLQYIHRNKYLGKTMNKNSARTHAHTHTQKGSSISGSINGRALEQGSEDHGQNKMRVR